MIVHCPECQTKLQVGPEMANQAVTCAHCDQKFLMPSLPAAKPAPAKPAAVKPRPAGARSKRRSGLTKNCANCGASYPASQPRCPECGIRYREGNLGGITRDRQIEESLETRVTLGAAGIAIGIIWFVWRWTQGRISIGIPALLIAGGLGSLLPAVAELRRRRELEREERDR